MKKEIEFIGIDIAKHKYDVCMGKDNTKKQYPNTWFFSACGGWKIRLISKFIGFKFLRSIYANR